MKLKPIVAAALLASSLSAFAVGPGNIGALTSTPVLIGDAVNPGIFFDFYNFTLSTASDVSGGIFSIPLPSYGISFLSVALFDNSFSQIGSTDMSPTTFTFSGLAAGGYHLLVGGVGTDTKGGIYAGAVVAQPVPEPETYAMMLAGLGALGFLARRRSKA